MPPLHIIKPSNGPTMLCVGQEVARQFTGDARVRQAAVYAQLVNPDGTPDGEPRFKGFYPVGPNNEIALPFTPVVDRNVTLFAIPLTAAGVAGASSLADAPQVTVLFNRETLTPTLDQFGAAMPDKVQLIIGNFTDFARKRRLKVADNAGMTGANALVFDSGDQIMPRYLDLLRDPPLQADFTWTGNDPAANGFTKTGSGTTAANGAAWRINTSASDAATYYTKNSFPASPFTNGFTLEITPPTVAASDGVALPNQSVAVRVEDGAKRYELTFDGSNVKLNGGSAHAHGGARVRLVIASGGAIADLWIGTTKLENDTAGASTSTSGLTFGDLATTDDSDASWQRIAYALTPQEPRLTQTVYVTVAHSAGSAYGPESAVKAITFADEFGGGGSAPDTSDQFEFWRQNYNYDQP